MPPSPPSPLDDEDLQVMGSGQVAPQELQGRGWEVLQCSGPKPAMTKVCRHWARGSCICADACTLGEGKSCENVMKTVT